jgi:hypothetical protein
VCGLAFAAVYTALALVLGYDPIATLNATVAAYRRTQHHRPYAFWLFGSPTAWWISLGLPIGWLAVRAATESDPSALGLVAVVVVSALLGFTNAETERIWLPYTPLASLAAAAVLRPRRLPPVLYLLAAQALGAELLFHTIW